MSKKKQREAELRAQEEAYLREQQATEAAAAAKAEEERRNSRPIAMEEYYNIAYAKERKRLNEMFGRINYGYFPEEQNEVEKIVYKEPDKSKFVRVEKYKKKKRTAGFFVATTIIFLLATVFFALEALGVIDFLPLL